MRVVRTDRGVDYPAEIRSLGTGLDKGRCDLVYEDGKIEAGVLLAEVSGEVPVPPDGGRNRLPFAQREAVNFSDINSALASNAGMRDATRGLPSLLL
jgi:hypothetical protein